jgi:type II secretory pathway pseudopilin PulG
MKTKIGYNLVIALVLFSSLITLVTTALQLYIDYRVDIKRVNKYEGLIRESYLKSITTSAWLYDKANSFL